MDHPTSEVSYLKERLNKQHEQQCLLEQIVSNISSLVEGSQDPMCIFDKDGFFMHVNASCRKLLGITEQPTSQKNIFDYYTTRDRDRVFKESVQRRALKWSGQVSFTKHNHEFRALQTIELLLSNKNNLDGTFFKSYITVQHENPIQEKIQVYYEMIRHMPVGVGIWRLEKNGNMMGNSLRLVCANGLASQYVGVSLHAGKDIHETLPNGAEVHQFLEEVIKAQRVSTLDKFRTAGGREVAVTAFPLSQEYVAVALEAPRKDNWASAVNAAYLGVAVCESMRVIHCNDPFMHILGGQKDIAGKDIISVLEQHVRPASRPQLFDLRRAILEARVHNVEVEADQNQWRICVNPLSDGFKGFLLMTYRINVSTPPAIHRTTFPILPHLREALPIAPQTPASTTTTTQLSSPPSTPKAPQEAASSDIFHELVDNFPCGIAIVKAERHQDIIRFRIISINRAARVFSTYLVPGKVFDERSPSPFDTQFVRLLIASSQTHERRVAGRLNLYGSCLALAARTIPLHDQCIGIAFEEASVVVPQYSQFPGKRNHAEVDCGYQILPSQKHSGIPSQTTTQSSQPSSQSSSPQSSPQNSPSMYNTKSSHDSPASHSRHGPFSPEPPNKVPRQLAPSLMDTDHLPFSATLPKPYLPPIHSTSAAISDILDSNNPRDTFEAGVFQQCVIGIACCDPKGQLSVVNRTFSQMLGYVEYELFEQSLLTFISPEDVDHVKSVLHQLACGEFSSMDVPVRFLHKRSHPVWALVTLLVNHKAVGERTHIVVQVQQANRLHKFPEVLLGEPEVLRSVFKDMAVGSAVLELGGPAALSVVCANSTFCEKLGVREDELRGQPLDDFIHPDDQEKAGKAVQDILACRSLHYQMAARIQPKKESDHPVKTVLSFAALANSKSKPFLLIVQFTDHLLP